MPEPAEIKQCREDRAHTAQAKSPYPAEVRSAVVTAGVCCSAGCGPDLREREPGPRARDCAPRTQSQRPRGYAWLSNHRGRVPAWLEIKVTSAANLSRAGTHTIVDTLPLRRQIASYERRKLLIDWRWARRKSRRIVWSGSRCPGRKDPLRPGRLWLNSSALAFRNFRTVCRRLQ